MAFIRIAVLTVLAMGCTEEVPPDREDGGALERVDAGPRPDAAGRDGGGAATEDAGSLEDASAADAGAATDGGAGTVYPAQPGVYLTITATGMAGTYALTGTVDCYDNGFITMSGLEAPNFVDLHLDDPPAAAQAFDSPPFVLALGIDDRDGAYYPSEAGGRCRLVVDDGWPQVRGTFSCEGLIGVESGVTFDVVDGQVVCPR